MKALLAQLRARNSHPQAQNSYITHDLTGCTNYIIESGSYPLKKTNLFVLMSVGQFSLH